MCSFTRGYTRKDNNNFKDMKTKRRFVSPQLKVAETDLEGLICGSPVLFMPVEVDEIHNINADSNKVSAESFYFEF